MSTKKKKRRQQVRNYCRFVAAGILFLVIVAVVSGCGSQTQEGSASRQKKVLSKSEIQELKELVVTDSDSGGSSYEGEDYDEDFEGVLTDDMDSNSHYTYVWGWKDRGEDDDEVLDPHILAQVSEDDKVLQIFSEEDLALYHGNKAETEFETATDQELVFYGTSDYMEEKGVWYRIPLSYENGEEKVLYDQKEVICENVTEDYMGVYDSVGKKFFCYDDDEIFILDQESGERKTVIKDDKKKSYGCAGSWISPEGEIYAMLNGCQNALVDSLYAYRVGTEEVQEITTGISPESKTAYEDGKVFLTGLADQQKQNDYNVYAYDMLTAQKKVLASEAEIREVLPEKPSEHADFIREMVYAKGTLYLETRFAGQSYVVSCDVETGDVMILEGLSELVKHREYQLSEPIENGNSRYYNINDHNIFEVGEDGVVERTLDGEYVRTIHLSYPYDLVYANNEELIYQYEKDPCKGSVLYSIPLLQMDGNDYPDINHRKILLKQLLPGDYGDSVRGRSFYADENYLIYTSNCHDFTAYDRKAQKFVDIAGIPNERQGFTSDEALENISGEYVVFDAHSRNRKKKGFLLYHFGDSKVTPLNHYGYNAYWTADGKTLVYEGWSGRDEDTTRVYSYDVATGRKQELFTEEDLDKLVREQGKLSEKQYIYYDTFFACDKIYYVAKNYEENKKWVVSYDLADDGELQYEAQITDFMNANQELELCDQGVAEGKLFIMKAKYDEEDDAIKGSEKYYYYDLETGKQAEISETDAEGLYLSLVNLYG